MDRSTMRLGEALAELGLPASDLVRRHSEDIREMGEHRAEDLLHWVKTRPVASVLIGAGVGYIIGRLAR